MTQQEFEKLVDKDKYQVFIFTSPCSIPVQFAKHPWFVVNKKGEIKRWEVAHINLVSPKNWDHLYQDFLPPWQGIRVFRYLPKLNNKSTLVMKIEGDENSIARKMADLIESSPTSYPFNKFYRFSGPNSNTYAQWVLDHFPELTIKLPWSCIGKNYKVK